MKFTPPERDTLQCLVCGHRFLPRRPEVQLRRCCQCGSTSTVAEGDLALASLALKPWAYLLSGSVPPLPLPHELAAHIGSSAQPKLLATALGDARVNAPLPQEAAEPGAPTAHL